MNKTKDIVSVKAEDLCQEILSLVMDTFVATYEKGDCSFVMRIPNGQKFCVKIEETK